MNEAEIALERVRAMVRPRDRKSAEFERMEAERNAFRAKAERLERSISESVFVLCDILDAAQREPNPRKALKRVIAICKAAHGVDEAHDRYHYGLTTVQGLRELTPVGDWFRPYALATYMRFPKEELVAHIGVAFRNWYLAEEALQRVSARARAAAGNVKLEEA